MLFPFHSTPGPSRPWLFYGIVPLFSLVESLDLVEGSLNDSPSTLCELPNAQGPGYAALSEALS